MHKHYHFCWLTLLLLATVLISHSQTAQRVGKPEQCATMPRLEGLFNLDPALENAFRQRRFDFNQLLRQRNQGSERTLGAQAELQIPVVFHIVLPNPNLVTDAQVMAQLDTLNRSFSGTNGDATRVPVYFQSLFGRSGIRFCLAQRNPAGEEATGINRFASSRATFRADDAVKSTARGGVDSWNTTDYFNIWITAFSDDVLGYATFPNDGFPAEQGVVIDYRSLPGGAYTSYNGGKTLVHEVGHYLNLYHIWGDDNGLCSGTDYVDDTPNQGNSSSGCSAGIRTDNCTSTGNGIMYQNYMDYSFDPCLVMFTREQVARMEASLVQDRPGLLQSSGCRPVVRKAFDARLQSINRPEQRLCSPDFVPEVVIRNRGSQTLTSLTINAQIDGGQVVTTAWTGSLPQSASTTVNLTSLTASPGVHVLTIYTTSPNGNADEDTSNDTLQVSFQYFPPVTSVTESFESSLFPPTAWDIVNRDGGITWQRVTGVAKTGTASAKMNNVAYTAVGQIDDLRLPQVTIPSTVDSAFFSFEVAAATFTDVGTPNNAWDTLEVLISADCGRTYTSLYKKWGSTLVTRTAPTTESFVPLANEWRKDSINLAAFIGRDNLLITFRNTTGYENNIYLDDVILRTVTINPNLKQRGFLVTPNPTSGQIAVQFYPQPAGLLALQVFNMSGQKLAERRFTSGQASNLSTFDLSRYAPGAYFVRAVFTDRVVTEKILKF